MSAMDIKEYQRKWRAKRKAMGLCCTCSRLPSRPGKRQCDTCAEKRRVRDRERYKSGICSCGQPRREGNRQCQACSDRWIKWYSQNKKRWSAYTSALTAKIRVEVLQHYGGKCVCCGESGIPFLTIDHKEHGKRDRERINSGYWWRAIRKMGFPDHLQVLCWNCNMAKQHFGKGIQCPHKIKSPEVQSLTSVTPL